MLFPEKTLEFSVGLGEMSFERAHQLIAYFSVNVVCVPVRKSVGTSVHDDFFRVEHGEFHRVRRQIGPLNMIVGMRRAFGEADVGYQIYGRSR